MPGENFYRKLIANAILFKTTDKLFGRKGVDAIGETNIKSFTVAYTLSYFYFLTDNRLDLWKIYEAQKIDENLQRVIKKLLVFVYDHITQESKNSLISEYAKRVSSWEKLKETKYHIDLTTMLEPYLISVEEKAERENEKEINNNVENKIFYVDKIQKMGLKFWDGYRIYLGKNTENTKDFHSAYDIYKKLKEGKNLTERDINFGVKVINYISEKYFLEEDIRALSNIEETEIIGVKFIYDKLLLISKEEWKRVIDLASQTKIFEDKELENVKHVQNTLLKNEKVKEQSLLKVYDSFKKLNRFGIKIFN